MVIVYVVLLAAGVTPLLAVLIKGYRYRSILRRGVRTVAHVTDRRQVRLHGQARYDVITYAYLPEGAGAAWQSGQHKFGVGQKNVGDTMEVYYLPADVARHALTGSRGEGWVLLGCVAFLALIVYGCTQLHETMQGKTITFNP